MVASVLLQTVQVGRGWDRFLTLGTAARDALVGAALLSAILLAGWLIAIAVSWIVKHMLRLLRFNDGMRGLVGHPVLGAHEPAALAAWAVYWVLLFATLVVAFDALGLDVGLSLAARLRDVLPRVLAATILLAGGTLVAMLMGAFTRRFFDGAGLSGGRLRGQGVTAVLTFFAVLLAIEQLGFAVQFVMAIGVIIASGVSIALALAFGLGCRDLARDFLIEYLRTLDDDRAPRA
jgi:hypothetical protein